MGEMWRFYASLQANLWVKRHSAKHHILEACFFRMTPFRSMLLTLQSGLQS